MIAIFGENIGSFLKNKCYDSIFAKISSILTTSPSFSCKNFGENIFKIITSVPGINVKYFLLPFSV
jgi:hypothetical protein